MVDSSVTLLAVDDDPSSLDLFASALEQKGLEIVTTCDPEEGLNLVLKRRPQIVLVDLIMPTMSGLDFLDRVVERDPAIDVVLITGHYSTDSAVKAIQRGACDYLTKPVDIAALRERIGSLIAEHQRRNRAQRLDGEVLDASQFEGIIGHSPQMLEVFTRIRRVAPHFRTVLITGDTGTGKELVARALHRLGPASAGRMVVANCAAIPENLIESELFGHTRGSFTGAIQDKLGLFEHADQGVLFLDELGELPLPAQTKLLRAVQQQEIQRIGSSTPQHVDVRIVAATNRDLRQQVRNRQFRDDLFYRLSMVEIRLPVLADRREDLPLLTRHFVKHFAEEYGKWIDGLTRRAELALARYRWPGNVRELENAIGHACMMTDGRKIDVCNLPDYLHGQFAQADGNDDSLLSLEEIQRLHTRRVVERMNGDKAEAAAILGVSRATLYRLLSDKVR